MARAMFEPIYRTMFPFWSTITDEEREYICNNSAALSYPKGTVIHDGTECSGVIMVRKGCLRVYMLSENGKDITLYRLHDGDLCMLSASCVLQTITFDVLVDAEEDSECYIVSGPAFAAVCENNPKIKKWHFRWHLTARSTTYIRHPCVLGNESSKLMFWKTPNSF